MNRHEPRPCAVDPDGHARRVLEFDKVLALVAEHAATAGARARIAALLPDAGEAVVAEAQATVAEAQRALESGIGPWAIEAADDARVLLEVAARPGSRLDPAELRRVAGTLAGIATLRRALDAQPERWPRIHALAAALVPHPDVVAAIHSCIDEHGELRENATPLLRQLRRQAQAEREALLRRLEGVLRESGGAAGDSFVTLRNDRFVIPVRADRAGAVRGIVHDRSASGATLFVEPLEALDANNELQRLRDAEQREIDRLLAELTGAVAAAAASALQGLDALEEIDSLQARGRWGRELEAAVPQRQGPLRLRAARHPLLETQLRLRGAAAVPLDLELGEARALVLTGPNAGGKTVALKTIGLLALLHQAGIPVPARAESTLPVFASVVADIGDEQSIEAAESTFSSHLRHVVQAVRRAGAHSLTLLDEFMAGTDPDEGAALAKVVLRRLVEPGGTTLVTTHLASLKLFAHGEPHLANAGMLFDTESRTPLYRLQPGVPGSSNALATAARLGLDPGLVEAARAERGEAAGRLEAALADLEAERSRLAEASAAADSARAEAERIREEHAVALAELAAKRRTALAATKQEAARLVAEAKSRIEAVVRELRSAQASAESIRAAQREMKELTDAVAPDAGGDDTPTPLAGPPEPGDRVWVRALGREGILEATDPAGRARVRFGNVTLSVAAQELQRLAPSPARRPATAAGTTPGGYTPPETPVVAPRLDLRGMEREAALEALEAFLDRMLLQGMHLAEIVHGKGTGVLRRAVQERLARHPDIAEFRLGEHGEGGSGVTIVKLR